MKKLLFLLACIPLLLGCEKDEKEVTNITLDVSELTIQVGEEYNFKVSHVPSGAKTPLYQWRVSKGGSFMNPIDIATIDNEGKFTATKEGETIVTVETTNNSGTYLSASCTVKIVPVNAAGIKLSKNELTLDIDNSATLTYTISPENTTYKDVVWTVSAPNIISNDKGKITAVGAGEVDVTVTIKNTTIKDVCKVKVNPKSLEKIQFEVTEKNLSKGDIYTIKPIFTPQNATNKKLDWSSSNANIATVDQNGDVTAISLGECIIKAISDDGGFEATCKIIIAPVAVQGIEFASNEYILEIGTTQAITANIKPENAENKNIKWQSGNPAIASVDNNGNVSAKTIGETTITAESEDGGYKAQCKIVVADIDNFIELSFQSQGLTIINGFITGWVYSNIINNSTQTIKLTRFYIIDGYTNWIIAETTNQDQLGYLYSGSKTNLGMLLNSVYNPVYVWDFEYQNKSYTVSRRYGYGQLYNAVEPNGKSSNLLKLEKK